MEGANYFVGQRVASVHFRRDSHKIHIVTDSAIFELKLSGDCCNDVSFSSIAGVGNLLGAVIKSVTLPDNYYDETSVIKFTTDNGVCELTVYNSGGEHDDGEHHEQEYGLTLSEFPGNYYASEYRIYGDMV